MDQMQLLTSHLILAEEAGIPWAGWGALLLGVGSALSGAASLVTALRKGRDDQGDTAAAHGSSHERAKFNTFTTPAQAESVGCGG